MDTAYSANGQRQTATPSYEISTMWERKPRKTPQKNTGLLMGPEQVTGPEFLQAMMVRFWCMHPSKDQMEPHS
jgi:hypothetical protein